jgi:hypothetical protein
VRVGSVVFAAVALLGTSRAAHAIVDLTGHWQLDISPPASTIEVDIVQNGTALTILQSDTPSYVGTIEPNTGVFVLNATSNSSCGIADVVTGVASSSDALTATIARVVSVGIPPLCGPATLAVTGTRLAANPPPASVLDHYKCYQGSDLKNPKFSKQLATTSDQLVANEDVQVGKIAYFCVPVDTNGEGINDASAHLVCYGVSAGKLDPGPRALVSTQFQMTQFEMKKPKLLCVPAATTLLQ